MSHQDNPQSAAVPPTDGQAGPGKPAQNPSGQLEGITRNESGQLVVRLKGQPEPLVDAKVARCFPWSMPDTFISVRNREGKEVVLLETLDAVDPAGRKILLQELHDKAFNPKIIAIVEHTSEFGITSIKARTDRGEVTFQIRSRDDVRILSSTRLLFRDADGNTYEVADASTLDSVSRRFLETYF
jgi:catechol 2,3-dioxygenase-like lactoylglutathione lyase family enzyme